MARLDYYALTKAIETQINNNVSNVVTNVESELLFGIDTPRQVGIYLMTRSAPADRQRLAAGKRTDFLVTFIIRCFGFDLSNLAAASNVRDDLIDDVENALMQDRTIDGNAAMSWLDGGDFFMAEDNGYIAAGDIRLVCASSASI